MGPLAGLRIVDLTSVGMGPYATQTLGDMGADVIKVESAEGDAFRDVAPAKHPHMGAPFLNLNRNKRSIVLDLSCDEDRSTLFRLLETADVFVSNLRPRSMRKLALDYESLRHRFPTLVHCGLYGFSEDGPLAGRPAFDDIIQAMSGLAALQGHHTGRPEYVNSIVADKIGGLAAVGAICMALFERERSGLGQAVEVPMFELMTTFNLVEHLAGATFIADESGCGYTRVLSPNRRPYATKDGYIAVLPYTTRQWTRFLRLAGRPELADDPNLLDPVTRSRTIGDWYAILGDILKERTTGEWLALLEHEDIAVAPIRRLDDIVTDEALKASGVIRHDRHPTEGEIRSTGIPVHFSRTAGSIRRLAPGLDEHRDEILRELEVAAGSCHDGGRSGNARSTRS